MSPSAQAAARAAKAPTERAGRAVIAALPADAGLLSLTGRKLIRMGRFELADAAVGRALDIDPDRYDALMAMAALHNRGGDRDSSRECLARAAAVRPVAPPGDIRPGLPNVLRLRALDAGRYGTTFSRSAGEHKILFKGGHFAITHLLDAGAVNLHVGNVLGDSLASADLAGADLVLNTIADADKGRAGLEAASALTRAHPRLPVINDPGRVLLTTRDRNHERLSSIEGLLFPRTARMSHGGRPRRMAADIEKMGFAYPYILRLAGTQTGVTVLPVGDRKQALDILKKAGPDLVFHVIAFHDCRDEKGRFRKMRCFFIDGRFHPVACLGSDHWQVHSGDRYRIMDADPELQAQERRWLDDPEGFLGAENMARLHAVRDIVGLDFFGIDFGLSDGRLIVFEANAAMRHNFDHADAFPYTRPHLERISAAFEAMVIERCAGVRTLKA